MSVVQRPSTAAWAPNGTSTSDQVFTITRNPYYFAVDPEGNQLPYIDEVRFTFFADLEALNLGAVAGEIDMQGRHIQMSSYPVLKENEAAGNYRVITWPTFGGSDAVVMFNQTWIANDPVLGALFQEKDFRVRPVPCHRSQCDQRNGLLGHWRGSPACACALPSLLSRG